MELPSPQTSGSKQRPSEPSVELANPRNEPASAPAPAPPKTTVKVYIICITKCVCVPIFLSLINYAIYACCMAAREQSQGYSFKF